MYLSAPLQALVDRARRLPPLPTAVVHPCDAVSFEGAAAAAEAGLIDPVLVAPPGRLPEGATRFPIHESAHSHDSAAKAVALVRAGVVRALMKGSLHTDELMGEVTRADTGLRTARRISHVFVMAVKTYPKLMLITDAAINIRPGLEDKADICRNAIDLARALGIERPKVAILSAVETVESKIPSTVEAAALCKMADRGQIAGGVLDGPLAFDNAISRAAADTKGIRSEVAGDADIFLVPDLESGNIMAKQLAYLAGAETAGIVLGARVPIILTSRSDSVATRLASAAVASLLGVRA